MSVVFRTLNLLHEMRHPAPAWRTPTPLLKGGPGEEAVWRQPVLARAPPFTEARSYGVSTSYVWDLSGTDKQCASYGLGHLIHWIHFKLSMREPSVVIPVTAVVDDDGLVHIEGDDLSLVRWNHRPALLRDALQRFGGKADWKPRWHLLAVPTEAFMGSARSVFNMARLGERKECFVIRTPTLTT